MNSDFDILKGYIEDLRRRKEAYDLSMTMLQRDYESQITGQETDIYTLQNELVSLKLENE